MCKPGEPCPMTPEDRENIRYARVTHGALRELETIAMGLIAMATDPRDQEGILKEIDERIGQMEKGKRPNAPGEMKDYFETYRAKINSRLEHLKERKGDRIDRAAAIQTLYAVIKTACETLEEGARKFGIPVEPGKA